MLGRKDGADRPVDRRRNRPVCGINCEAIAQHLLSKCVVVDVFNIYVLTVSDAVKVGGHTTSDISRSWCCRNSFIASRGLSNGCVREL